MYKNKNFRKEYDKLIIYHSRNMELKLFENLDKIIWENIEKASDKELDEMENIYDFIFPKEDRKYLKAFSGGKT